MGRHGPAAAGTALGAAECGLGVAALCSQAALIARHIKAVEGMWKRRPFLLGPSAKRANRMHPVAPTDSLPKLSAALLLTNFGF